VACAEPAPWVRRVEPDQASTFSAMFQASRWPPSGARLGVLRLVLVLELGEVQRHVLGQAVFAAAAAGRERGDDHFFIVILMYSTGVPPALRTTSLASGKWVPLQARQHQGVATLSTYLVKDRSCTLTLPAAATAHVGGAALGHAPAPGENVDLPAWVPVFRFALMVSILMNMSTAMVRSPKSCPDRDVVDAADPPS
jgi:hypothetical protein